MQLQPELRSAWSSLEAVVSPEQLLQWIEVNEGNENQNLEFKSQIDTDYILKVSSAFGNSIGGILLIGVKDNPITTASKPNTTIISKQQRESETKIRTILRDGFYYNSPLYELKYLPNLEIFALLLYGNEREPILYITKDKAIAGARRKDSSSVSFTVQETLASADRWRQQRELILARYNNLPPSERVSESDLTTFRTALFFMSSLPIPPFAKPINSQQLNFVEERLRIHAPMGLRRNRSIKTLFEFKGTSPDTAEHSYDISLVQDQMYRIRVNGNIDEGIEFNQRLILTAIYATVVISRLYDSSELWSIQGKYTVAESTTAHLIDPVFISLRGHFNEPEYTLPRIGERCRPIQLDDVKKAMELYRELDDHLQLHVTQNTNWDNLESVFNGWWETMSQFLITR